MNNNEQLKDAITNLFSNSQSVSGEEELLRLAAEFAIELTPGQIQVLCLFRIISMQVSEFRANQIREFVKSYLEFKRYNNSKRHVRDSLDSISLAKWIKTNAFNVNMNR